MRITCDYPCQTILDKLSFYSTKWLNPLTPNWLQSIVSRESESTHTLANGLMKAAVMAAAVFWAAMDDRVVRWTQKHLSYKPALSKYNIPCMTGI